MNSVSPRSGSFPSFQQWSPLGVLASVIFIIDLLIPLGVAAGVLYITVVLLSLRQQDSQLPLWIAGGCTILTIIAIFISPVGGEFWKVLTNRGLALFVIWTTTLMGRIQLQQAWAIEHQDRSMQNFMNMLPSACFSFDRQGTILSWNPGAEKIYGYSEQEAVGASSYDLIVTPKTKKETQNVIDKIFQGEATVNKVWHDQNKQGELGWRAGSVFPIFSRNGQIAYGININIDITAQKTAETNLQNQKLLIEAILDSSSDAIYAKNHEGKYLLVNQAAAHAMGHTPESAIGLDDVQIFGSEHGSTIQKTDAKILSHGQSILLEESVVTGNNFVIFSTTKSPLKTSDGTTIGLVGISRDITLWKQTQLDLLLTDRVFMASNDHISILGHDYRYRRVNPSYEKIHGRHSQRVVGMSVSELLGQEVFEETVKPKLDQCFQGEEVHYEAWFRFADNQKHYMAVSYLPLISANNDIDEIVVIARDWTERKQMEETLLTNQQQLRTILDAMTNFVGIGTAAGIITDCNQPPLTLGGLTREDVIGKNFVDTHWLNYSPKTQEQVRGILQRVSQGEIVREDYQARMDGDLIVTVDACFVPVKDKKGQVQQIVHSGIDVTERRQNEAALHASEEQFRDLYESAPLAYFSASWDGHITRVNGRASEILGYSRQELMGKQVLTLYAPTKDGHEKASLLQMKTQQGIAIQDEELEMLKKDGTTLWVSLTVRLIYDHSGKILERRGMVQDISDRKRIESELRTSEYRFRSLVETAGSLIIGLTPDGWIVEWNRAAEQLYGKSRKEVLDKNYFELFFPASDRLHIMEEIEKVLKGTASRDYPDSVFTSQGETRKILWNVDRLLDEQNKPYGVICVGRDITNWEQDQIQLQRQALMFSTIREGVLVTDLTGSILDWNLGAELMFGYPMNEALGQTPAFLHHPAEPATLTQDILSGLDQKGQWRGEIRFVRKDGRPGVCETTVTPLKDNEGKLLGTIGVNRDMTRRKEVEAALMKSEERFRNFFETGLVGMAMISLDYGWLEMNAQFCTLLGYSQEELTQKTWDELTYPDDLHMDKEYFEEIIAGTRISYSTSKRYLRKDGSLMYANLYINAHRDTSHQVEYFTAMIEDVTEQKQGEALLMKWAMIFQHTQWGVAVSQGASTQFEMVNEAYARMHGYGIRELEGKSVADVMTPASLIQLPNILEKIHQDGFLSYEARHIRKNGSTFPSLVTESAIKDINGQTLYRVTNVIDISDLKSAEEALKASEQRLSMALEASSSGTWDWNIQTGQVVMGGEWLSALGYQPEDLAGNVNAWKTIVHPDDLPHAKKAMSRHFAKQTTVYESINRVRMKNGQWRWNYDRGRIVEWTPDGKPLRMVGTDTDITARKEVEEALRESEQRFRTYFETGLVGMTITSLSKEWIEVNNRLCSMLGYSRDELLQKTWPELTYPEDLRIDDVQFKQLLSNTITSYSMEKRFIRKDGSLMSANLYVNNVKNSSGHPEYITTMIEDISERKVAEQQLQDSQAWIANIVNIANDAVIAIDENQYIQLFNQGAEKIFGYRKEEMLGQPLTRLLPKRFSANHLKHINSFANSLDAARQMGERGEVYGLRKNGEEFPAEASISHLQSSQGSTFTVILRDVTEHRLAQQAMAQLAAIVVSSDDAIMGKDLEGTINYWNQSAERLFGYTAEEAIGQHKSVLVPPDRKSEVEQNLSRIQDGEIIQHFETVRQHKDGTHIDVTLSISPIRNAQGTLIGASTIARDITEQKRSQEALRQSERMANSTMNALTAELCVIDESGLILSTNGRWDEFARINSGDPANLGVGINYMNVCTVAGKRGCKEAELFLNGLKLVLSRQQTDFSMDYQCSSPFNQNRWYTARITRFPDPGPIRAVIAHEDITALKQAQATLQKRIEDVHDLYNKAPCGYHSLDDSGRYIEVNDTELKWLGYTREEVLGRQATDFLDIESQQRFREIFPQYVESGEISNLEAVYRRKDGTTLSTLVNATTVRNMTGEYVRSRATMLDISERKKFEEAIQKHNMELEGKVEERSIRIQELEHRRMQVEKLAALAQIAAGVAHEINNPLASISQSLVLLKRAIPTDHPHFRYMAKTEDCVQRIADITKRLYQLYRPSGPKLSPIDLRLCIQTAMDIMEEQALKHEIQIKVSNLPNPIMMVIAEGELIQVLCNLLHNAIDATDEKGTIDINLNAGLESLTLSVQDQGEGIPPEAVPHVFEPFFTTKINRVDGGMGLGLSISHSLIESMGGSLDFSTSLGHGSTFTITLPLT